MKKVMLAVLLVAVLVAGCGSGGAGIDKAKLEDGITRKANLVMLGDSGNGNSTAKTTCVTDGDDYHFSCLVEVSGGQYDGEVYNMTAQCDKSGGGSCVWGPK